MLGTIIGDIAGSEYEFNNTSDYNFPMFDDHKDFTDDTICSIAIADALLNGMDYQSSLQKWCRKYPNPMGSYGSHFKMWIMSRRPSPYGSYGNGSAMRVSPVGWLLDSEERVREEAEKSAAITHNHPEGIKGAVAIAVAIFRMRTAETKTAEIFKDTAVEFYGEGGFSNLPRRNVFDVTCQGCVPLAFLIASEAESFEDAIRRAVAYGGDTDTVGAIVGSLAEARFGIPEEFIAKAKEFLPEEMLKVVTQFEKRICGSL